MDEVFGCFLEFFFEIFLEIFLDIVFRLPYRFLNRFIKIKWLCAVLSIMFSLVLTAGVVLLVLKLCKVI